MKKFLLALFLLCPPVFAALPATTVWEVRQAGAFASGGCFDPVLGAGNSDYSQQNAAQYSGTNLVLVTATTMSSVTHSFITSDIGNCIHITAGTNFTQGFYVIQSVAAGVATVDRSAGTIGATGGTFAVGGALAFPMDPLGTSATRVTALNKIWVKADAVYVITSSTSATNLPNGLSMEGYTTTRGDGGSFTMKPSGNGIVLLSISTNLADAFDLENVILDCDSRTSSTALATGTNGVKNMYNIRSQGGCTQADIVINSGASDFGSSCTFCTVTGSKGLPYSLGFGAVCYVCANKDPDSAVGVIFTMVTESHCIMCVAESHASASASDCFQMGSGGGGYVVESTCYNAGRDGVRLTCSATCVPAVIVNNIFYTGVGTAINNTGAWFAPAIHEDYNGIGGFGAVRSAVVNAGTHDVTISADPFTSKSTNDYSLNRTAGGGAALRGVGLQHTMPIP